MKVRKERQLQPIADEVLALTSLVRPILLGTLYSIARHKADAVGGYEKVTLELLPSLHRQGDGDCGTCFEYAVHEAIAQQDGRVLDRVSGALKLCNIKSDNPASILFGLEKSGALQLIETALDSLTDDSRVLVGTVGQPPKLKKHIVKLAGAFRNSRTRLAFPNSIRGLWKADLFVGNEADQWVGTTIKINPRDLQGDKGLRVGIVPIRQGYSDNVRFDSDKNLVICPLQHDFDFMQAFYTAWRIVQAFMGADAKMPKDVDLPIPTHMEVCRILYERRKHPVVDVVDAIEKFGQRHLTETAEVTVGQKDVRGSVETDLIVAPVARRV